jgi:hypothetical protein
LQRHLVQAEAEEYCRSRRRCQHCGAQRPLKDIRPRRLTSLFGVVQVRAARFRPCRCGVASRRTITPVAEIMPDRCTPEYERALAKMGALLPYRRARSLLEKFFPLGDPPEVETIRQRTLRVGASLEREAVAPPTSRMREVGERYPGFYRFAKVLERTARGIQSGAIPVPGGRQAQSRQTDPLRAWGLAIAVPMPPPA